MQSTNSWRDNAACAKLSLGESEEMFFPGQGQKSTKAQKYCKTQCSVREECIIYATLMREQGIWGGTTESERKSWWAFKQAKEAAKRSPYLDIRALSPSY